MISPGHSDVCDFPRHCFSMVCMMFHMLHVSGFCHGYKGLQVRLG